MTGKGVICRILTSDKVRSGEKEDLSRKYLEELARRLEFGHKTIVTGNSLVEIRDAIAWSLLTGCDIVLVTGGTGPSHRDVSVDAAHVFAEKEIVGMGEYHRLLSYKEGVETAWLSRATMYTSGKSLIIVIPGNPDALRLLAQKMADLIEHILEQLEWGTHRHDTGK